MTPKIVPPSTKIFQGRPPLGYVKRKGIWTVDPWAADRIKLIIAKFYEGKRPVEVLNCVSAMYPRKREGRSKRIWHYSELWNILRNARLYCLGEYRGVICPDLAFVPKYQLTVMSLLKIKDQSRKRVTNGTTDQSRENHPGCEPGPVPVDQEAC